MEVQKERVTEKSPNSELTRETTSSNLTPHERDAAVERKSYFKAYYTVYYLTGLLEILLLFRFIFKLLGANSANAFVALIYGLTDIFLAPFIGIFPSLSPTNTGQAAMFDPAILIAMVVYGLIGIGLQKIISAAIASNSAAE